MDGANFDIRRLQRYTSRLVMYAYRSVVTRRSSLDPVARAKPLIYSGRDVRRTGDYTLRVIGILRGDKNRKKALYGQLLRSLIIQTFPLDIFPGHIPRRVTSGLHRVQN